jgi:hypothetical protein
MVARLSVLRTGRTLLRRNMIIFRFWYSLLLEAEWTPRPSEAGRKGYVNLKIRLIGY